MPTVFDKKAEGLARKGLFVEAGFVVSVLAKAPAGADRSVISMVRSAYFFGAKHMLDTMLAAQQRPDDEMARIADNVRAEFEKFFEMYERSKEH